MNNKGFIATSLIYSFFLIFITLFLTIIADYLQNKVLLNTIENGIKDNINNTKSIEDFEVGDFIEITITGSVHTEGYVYGVPDNSSWLVAAIKYDNQNTPDDDSELILYKITPDKSDEHNVVTAENVKSDLELTGNYNDTRINELILSTDNNYILPYNGTSRVISKECTKVNINETDPETIDIDSKGNCDTGPTSDVYRERKVITEWNEKRVTVNPDSFTGITITGEV